MEEVPEDPQRHLYDSDYMEEPEQEVGDELEVCSPNKVTKEILQLGTGVRYPNNQFLWRCRYKMYFYDHTEIESTNGEIVDIILNSKQWPEGLRMAIGKMRKGEKAKIKMKKSYAFGTNLDPDLLRIPKGWEEGDKLKRLQTKGVIYELELVDWDIRDDITNDGQLVKIVHTRSKASMEKPNGIDEVTIDIKIYQKNLNTVYFERENWTVLMNHPDITTSGTRVLETMRVGEVAEGIAQPSYFTEHDKAAIKKWGLQTDKELIIYIKMIDYITVIDWYGDWKTLRRTLKRGYKRVPFYESTVSVRFKIEVNGEEKLNNMFEETEYNIYKINNRAISDIEKKKKLLNNLKVIEINEESQSKEDEREKLEKEIEELRNGISDLNLKSEWYKFTLYEYKLPSLISKVIKTMYKDEISQINTNRVDKLTNNFSSDFIKKEWFNKEGENKIQIVIHLQDFDEPEAFNKLSIQDKLTRIQSFKKIATDFFKAEEFKKAWKMYQKINGYYTFGDANNNYLKEDETKEHFQKCYNELWSLRESWFMNVAVCKYKAKQYDSIIDITNQVIDFSPKCLKAWYFRGRAFSELQEYDYAVDSFKNALEIDPNHKPSRTEFDRIKKIRVDHINTETKKYSKIFG